MTNFSKSKFWNKKGLIFAPEKQFPWLQTHAQNPFPENLGNGVFRIHFASRDKKPCTEGILIYFKPKHGVKRLS